MGTESVETVFANEYFGINKRLQEFSGLWPYRARQDKILRRCLVILSLSIVAFPNVNAVRIWCGSNLALCTENICGLSYLSLVMAKYFATFLNERAMRQLYEEVASRWLSITDEEEKKIMVQYARLGWLKSVGYFVFQIGTALVIITLHGFNFTETRGKIHSNTKILPENWLNKIYHSAKFWSSQSKASGYMLFIGVCVSQIMILPVVLDYILPLNETRQKRLIVKAEYVVDPYEYYYEIYAIYCICGIMSVPVFASVDTTFTAVVHQNLGVFNVVRYRLKKSTEGNISANNDHTYDTIVSAVKLHGKSLEMISLIDSSYYLFFFMLIGITVLLLACGAITILENTEDAVDLVRMCLFEVATAIHLFYFSWSGQLVVNESSEIFPGAYMNQWYLIPKRSKILLKVIMCRCLMPCQLTAGGLYVMNFESFGSTMRAAMSYITVLGSFRA